MKVPTDNLFQLIQAMTASEKRYFKRHYASEKSITTELFDFINSMKSYKEEEVKSNFPNSKVSKNLKVYKVQLTDLVLKSLISYHNKKSIRSKIRIGLEEIELLMSKQLYGLAQTRIKKVKELCLKYEELEYIFAVLFYEIMISSFFDIELKTTDYPILEEFDLYTDKIKNTYRLKKINFSLSDKSNNKLLGNITKEEEAYYLKILKEESLKAEQGTLSFNEEFYLNSSYSLISKLINDDHEKEYEFKKKNVKLFEDNPHFIENHANYYYAALYNFLISCRNNGEHEELEKGIEKIKKFTIKYPFLERNLIFVYYLELKYNYQNKKYSSLVNGFENNILKHIKKYSQGEANLPSLCFIYFTLTHMILNNPQKVQFYLRRLHGMSKQLDPSFTQFFDVLELISHYETGDLELIQNMLGSLKRKVKKQKLEGSFYVEMLSFFSNLISNSNYKPQLVADLKRKVDQAQGDGLLNLLNEFILSNWLDAVQNNISFSKVMQKRHFV